MFKRAVIYLFVIWLVFPAPSHAQMDEPTTEQEISERVTKSEDKNYISLSIENDSIGGGTDRYYTSGVRLTYFNVNTPVPKAMDEVADFIPTFDVNETTSSFFTIGQNIYTPQDITVAANQPNDRPYAGWLYGSGGITTIKDNHIDEIEVTVGIVGDAALGEAAQDFIHDSVIPADDPQGWDNQLKFEPGLIISAGRRWPRAMRDKIGPLLLRGEPNVNASIGNIHTYAAAGMTFTLGPADDPFQDAPVRVRPAMPGSGYFETPPDGWSWFIFAGAEGRAVARNIFLDGNTFRDSNSVDKKHFVGDLNAGIALTYDDYRLGYSYTVRSKEFDGQERVSEFGSLTLSTKF